MRPVRFWARVALVTLLAGAWALSLAAEEESQEEPLRRAILTIGSGEPGLPWTDQMTRGFVDAVESSGRRVSLYFEHLDLIRFDEPEYLDNLRDWLRLKYANQKIDLIVLRGEPAVELLSGVEDWNATPKLYTELGRMRESLTARLTSASGFFVESPGQAALATVKHLLPETERVAFVYGASETEQDSYSGFARSIRAAGLEPLDLGGLTMESLLERVARLPERTVVFFFPVQVDAGGKAFTSDAACALVSKAANRSMFSLYRTFLGCGVVGGVMLDFETWGEALAARALEALDTPSLETIIVPVEHHARPAFDARELERWGISEDRLPPGSVVAFREPSLWREYRPVVLVSVAVGLVQALLIGGLLLERRRRQRAELAARGHLATMAHVDRRSALGELAASLAHELGQPLAAIQANAQAAELMLAKESPDTEELRHILDDIRSDDLRAAEIIRGMREFLGKRELKKGPVDMNALIAETLSIVTPDAKSRGIQLTHDPAPRSPYVAGERIYLQQVLLNLLLNGIAAVADAPSDRRGLSVRTAQDNGTLEVIVSDTGHGIPEDQLSRIFEPFVTTKERGLGVGLSVARSIVEAHDGEIDAENNPAGGATFRIRLPIF